MSDESTNPFPELRSVCKPSGPKFNHLNWNWNVANTQQNSELSGGQNSSSNAWRHPNKLSKWHRVGKSNNTLDKVNSQKTLACSGNGIPTDSKLPTLARSGNEILNETPTLASRSGKGILNDSKLPPQEQGIHSSVGVHITSSNDYKNGQCKDERIPEPHCENNDVKVDITSSENCKNDQCKDERNPEPHCESNGDEIGDSESNIVFDSEDDFSLDDTDSDTGEQSHEGCKKSKWFNQFFDNLNKLTIEEINSQERQWHCPACQGGPGAIDWYQGLQPLLNHSKTIKARRVRLHRLFAETLGEECFRRRAPLTMDAEVYGKWEGLDKKVKDHEIVWPPMVVIMNTRYEQDESNKWNGMGNQELLDCFSDYAALKARHSYGPQGHRGMSVLIFEASTAGYLESKRLHEQFEEQGRGREAWNRAWNRCRHPFVPGVNRKLYGCLASREDLDNFNRHSGGKSNFLKFEMRSYQETVESMIKVINNDSKQIEYLKNKIAKEQIKSEVLADTLRIKLMNALEKFVQEQIQNIQQAIDAKEDEFEKLQQAEKEKLKHFCGDSSEEEEDKHRSRDEDMMQFDEERYGIMKVYGEKKLDLKKKLWKEQVELEKELENELMQLMDKYTSANLKNKAV
ncbi:protein SUPPRESSOR OF GENE SILENCING 3-like [Gastrolobium bilobum]|uniref:protein SUPPRESSOR OF GENE SILENCING 3-like n=1 Tax=Gastrolobium bilobum TaxID=150636 RepID=UPI002AB1CEE5|nr:protein SUPPRESSOR OF GENE SILENCING 3-like [Gastrolobium bilobum]